MLNEKFTPTYVNKRIFFPDVVWNGANLKLRFNRSYLKQNRAPYTPKNVVNLFIAYELDTWSGHLNTDFAIANCFFRAVNLTKNADPDKYKHSGYGIGFYSR